VTRELPSGCPAKRRGGGEFADGGEIREMGVDFVDEGDRRGRASLQPDDGFPEMFPEPQDLSGCSRPVTAYAFCVMNDACGSQPARHGVTVGEQVYRDAAIIEPGVEEIQGRVVAEKVKPVALCCSFHGFFRISYTVKE
jgi:hypothetical protein